MMPPMPTDDSYAGDMAAGDMGAAAPMPNGELCVPLDALASAGDDDQMENPTQGSMGEGNFEWTVNRIEGPNAYIAVTAVNGNKIEAPEASEEADEDAEEASIRKAVETQPSSF